MSPPAENGPQEGDELWLGLVGPVRVSDEITSERQPWINTSRAAQSAQSLDDLTCLVTSHPDFRVRSEAIPRLRARFPDAQQAIEALAAASTEADHAVRDAAAMALQWMARPDAADAIAEAWALEWMVGPVEDE